MIKSACLTRASMKHALMKSARSASFARATLATFLVGGLGLACGEGPTAPEPPTPGELTVSYQTPHTDDRAALFKIVVPTGVTVPSVAAASGRGYEVFTRQTADTLRIAVFGDLVNGAAVRFDVPDTRALSTFSVQVLEVSAADNSLRASLAGHAVTITR